MITPDAKDKVGSIDSKPAKGKEPSLDAEISGEIAGSDEKPSQPREIGGRAGPDPTRYGDWEKAGRCIDF